MYFVALQLKARVNAARATQEQLDGVILSSSDLFGDIGFGQVQPANWIDLLASEIQPRSRGDQQGHAGSRFEDVKDQPNSATAFMVTC